MAHFFASSSEIKIWKPNFLRRSLFPSLAPASHTRIVVCCTYKNKEWSCKKKLKIYWTMHLFSSRISLKTESIQLDSRVSKQFLQTVLARSIVVSGEDPSLKTSQFTIFCDAPVSCNVNIKRPYLKIIYKILYLSHFGFNSFLHTRHLNIVMKTSGKCHLSYMALN